MDKWDILTLGKILHILHICFKIFTFIHMQVLKLCVVSEAGFVLHFNFIKQFQNKKVRVKQGIIALTISALPLKMRANSSCFPSDDSDQQTASKVGVYLLKGFVVVQL